MAKVRSTAERFRRAGGGDDKDGETCEHGNAEQATPALAVDTIQPESMPDQPRQAALDTKEIKILIQTLGRPDRQHMVSHIQAICPNSEPFQAINGYNADETIDALVNANVRYFQLQPGRETYGSLANWLTKLRAFEYQTTHSIEYMCLLEDDLCVCENFSPYLQSLLPLLKDPVKIIRLCSWGEGYVTHIDGARAIVDSLRARVIIENIDNQLRDHCCNELFVNYPCTLWVASNHGDCMKTDHLNTHALRGLP